MIKTDWRGVLALLGMLLAVIAGLLFYHEPTGANATASTCEKEKRATNVCEEKRLEVMHDLQICQEMLVNETLKIRR
jgi:hypothetical protein